MNNKKPVGVKRPHDRRVSAVMRLSLSCESIANDVQRQLRAQGINITFSPRAIAKVGQIIAQTIEKQWAKDLHTFANHAKRTVPNVSDAQLLYRKDPNVKQRVEQLIRSFNREVHQPDDGIVTADKIPSIKEHSERREAILHRLDSNIEDAEVTAELEKLVRATPATIVEEEEQPAALERKNDDIAPQAKPSTPLQTKTAAAAPPQARPLAPQQTKPAVPLQLKLPAVAPQPANEDKGNNSDDSFYNDDDIDWANIIPAMKPVEPVPTPSPVEMTDAPWFKPDGHSTPANAPAHRKLPDKTLNLSTITTTPHTTPRTTPHQTPQAPQKAPKMTAAATTANSRKPK